MEKYCLNFAQGIEGDFIPRKWKGLSYLANLCSMFECHSLTNSCALRLAEVEENNYLISLWRFIELTKEILFPWEKRYISDSLTIIRRQQRGSRRKNKSKAPQKTLNSQGSIQNIRAISYSWAYSKIK